MAIVEEVPDEPDHSSSGYTKDELLKVIRKLLESLTLPEEFLPGYMDEDKDSIAFSRYRSKVVRILNEIIELKESESWGSLNIVDQGEVFSIITRFYGEDNFTSTKIVSLIDKISIDCNTTELAIHLLKSTLRPLFSSHPMLNPSNGRALSRPAGGPEAMSDLHDSSSQIWKSGSAWGNYNILSWCCINLSSESIIDNIGLILPPTLMMMDDYEPSWRGRGIKVLDQWINKISVEMMKRMGMDKLLLNSLIHTLSLHPNPPLKHVMPLTLELITRTTVEGSEKRADWLLDVMEKAILTGWMYAPSGPEGRVILIQVARDLESVCEVIGHGVIRWMKTIIPNLLQPLSYPPTISVIPHFEANLSALLCTLRAVGPTGRIPRWRGQIIDVMSRLVIQLGEREKEDIAVGMNKSELEGSLYQGLKEKVREVFVIIAETCPGVENVEFERLLEIDRQLFETVLLSKPVTVV